ncbi:hypothetical protein DAPPUDRAFT_270216 [Daphnia pulex]|uniref:Retrotransposon gag domain-containing protein n=1 Tax=Daphnia pulex TaxID=6669 RepID=E9I0C4_DAPPU|nr:hypothetical protein DAPPUDRAFT_270216 [Daphnia pulex]|eukprot:EFX62556.1 hypothetical protein DAPPUDRAFT_270216 [Daphnia pulex]
MANNINAALMRADLAKLPLWSGDVSKDGYTIEQWVTRVNKAAATAAWSDEDTMAYVYNALRGPALRWLESLKRFNVNIDSWAAVRTEMLDAYSRVQTARTAVVNLSDLKQGQNESVTDFGARVARTVDDLEHLMPAASRVPQGVDWADVFTGLAGWAAVTAAQKATQLQEAANKVIWATYNHLGVQLFISNLKPTLRDELMKAPPTDLNAAIKAARQLEKIHTKPENGHATVSEIGQSNPQASADDVDQQIEALSAQFQALLKRRQANSGRGGRGGRGRGSQGRGGRGRGRGQAQGNNGASSSSYNTCRYCKKPGHLQKVCNSRIRAGAPEVDAQGKPYSHGNEMDQEDEDYQGDMSNGNPWGQQQQQQQDWNELQEVYNETPDFL